MTINLKDNKIYAAVRNKCVADAKRAFMNSKNPNTPHRFAIDHSAKFYPIISTKKTQSIFCIGAVMKRDVDKDLLEKAVNDVMPRFPAYKVRLKKGYSWHYFENNDEKVKVFDGDGEMLRPIDPKETNGYLFRLSGKGKEIKLEIFHALTDGNGTLDFLKTILKRYGELSGCDFEKNDGIVDWKAEPCEEEIEDCFEKHYKPIKLRDMHLLSMAGKPPHRINGTMLRGGYVRDIAVADADEINLKAKSMGASFTAYITGILAYSIEKTSNARKPIVVMVPVNLRKIYPSVTMRNFVTFVRILIKPDSCKTLEEYVDEAKRQLKEKSSKGNMDAFVSTTVRAQKNVFLKVLPLFLKTFFIKFGRLFMRSRQTIIYSNLGALRLPQQMGIESLVFNTNVSKNNTQNLGSITFNGNTCFAFTRAIAETVLPDTFFACIKEQGIKISRK